LNGKKFLLSDDLTIVDFYLFELLENGIFFTDGKLFETYKNLESFWKSFKELKAIKDHIENSKTYKTKFNNKIAKVNN